MFVENIDQVSAEQWNALHASDNPFIQHAFLAALERHGCVSQRFGWLPRHLLVYAAEELVAAMPLYEKRNNYGEFVFDQPWERAWQSVGLAYYPKLVSVIPYTPALGPRLLIAPPYRSTELLKQHIFERLIDWMTTQGYSGLHLLFSTHQPTAPRPIVRHDVQFQWFNQNYANFDAFLAQLKPKKRKNIRQERRALYEQGIRFRCLNGTQTTAKDWEAFDYFYQKTFLEKWSTPTLNRSFFEEIARTMPQHILLVLAEKEGQTIAGALMFRSQKVLYGRHWGCAEEIKHLHFETCFYQGIDYAIAEGIERFEPGAGGEHKIARGFVPVRLSSSHWLSVNPFEQPLQRFVAEERSMIDNYIASVWPSTPYQEPEALQPLAQANQTLD
ncbi:MAG: N-acetyltransferase [Thiotrichales bacterium]|nr:N-acetyltransferase [Thiotrichales bacterium]